MTLTHISSGSSFEDEIGYSRAVIDGDYVFVSGTTGFDYENMEISDAIERQAEQCFRNLQCVLESAGASFDDVVRIRYLLPDREDFEPCWPIFKRFLGDARPAATMMVTGLYDERMKIEIEVTARLPSSSP